VCYKFTSDLVEGGENKNYAIIDNANFVGKICLFLNRKLDDSKKAVGIFWATDVK